MKVTNFITDLNKVLQNNKLEKLKVIVGDGYESDPVAAVIILEKPTNYRESHLHISNNLESLITELRYYYDFSEDDFANCVLPISGFTITDLLTYVC